MTHWPWNITGIKHSLQPGDENATCAVIMVGFFQIEDFLSDLLMETHFFRSMRATLDWCWLVSRQWHSRIFHWCGSCILPDRAESPRVLWLESRLELVGGEVLNEIHNETGCYKNLQPAGLFFVFFTHWGTIILADILQRTFSNTFS